MPTRTLRSKVEAVQTFVEETTKLFDGLTKQLKALDEMTSIFAVGEEVEYCVSWRPDTIWRNCTITGYEVSLVTGLVYLKWVDVNNAEHHLDWCPAWRQYIRKKT